MSDVPSYEPQLTSHNPPTYTSGHSYSLESKGSKWLNLHVNSPGSKPPSLPIFREGESISGQVELNLEKPESLKGVTIEVQAGTTAVGQEEIRFLDISETLWTPSKTQAKLSGQHSWAFEITLPKEVAVAVAKGEGRMYKLPPNFTEKASPAYIDYRLVVTVKRGAFKVNQTLSMNFAYLPKTLPDPPSELRRLAYDQGSTVCGPDLDPEGWEVLPPTSLKGTLFGVQNVEVECTLAIATPLCYALGSPMPLFLTLKSANKQALDILSAPAAIRVHLARSLGIGANAAESTKFGRTNNHFVTSAGQALFWDSDEQQDHVRKLQGELEITNALKPSFVFPRFTVKYHLQLLPFSATGWRASGPENAAVLLSEQVDIATQHTPGVLPRSTIPPGYRRPEQVNFNNTVGFLENGNQRFWHH